MATSQNDMFNIPKPRTDKVCKEIIRNLARKLGIEPPSLITTRLMSEDDKEDMRQGLLTIEALETHIKVWKETGMRDLRNIPA